MLTFSGCFGLPLRFGALPFFRKQYLVYCWISTLVSSVKITYSKPSCSFNAFRQKTKRFVLFLSQISWQYRAFSCFQPSFRLTFLIVDVEIVTPRSSRKSFWSSQEVNSSLSFIFPSMKFLSSSQRIAFRPLLWASSMLPVLLYLAINEETLFRDVFITSFF